LFRAIVFVNIPVQDGLSNVARTRVTRTRI
jgi:hypothetical protein